MTLYSSILLFTQRVKSCVNILKLEIQVRTCKLELELCIKVFNHLAASCASLLSVHPQDTFLFPILQLFAKTSRGLGKKSAETKIQRSLELRKDGIDGVVIIYCFKLKKY